MEDKFASLIAGNEATICVVKGCQHHRVDMSRFCKTHLGIYRRSGHPNGSVVNLKEMKPVRNDVRAFLLRHAAHPGVVAAIGWLDRSIANSFVPAGLNHYMPPETQALELWHRLKARGVTGEEVFETLAAMVLLRSRKPDRFHNEEEWQTQVGTKVVRHRYTSGIAAKGQHSFTGRAARRHLGETVMLNIGVLLERLVDHLEREKLSPPIAQLPGLDTPFDTTVYGAGPDRK